MILFFFNSDSLGQDPQFTYSWYWWSSDLNRTTCFKL